MIVTIIQVTKKGIERQEYTAHGVKCSSDLLALDLEGVGWRTIELKDISSYEIREA